MLPDPLATTRQAVLDHAVWVAPILLAKRIDQILKIDKLRRTPSILVLHDQNIPVKDPLHLHFVESEHSIPQLRLIVIDLTLLPIAMIKDHDGILFAVASLIRLREMKP